MDTKIKVAVAVQVVVAALTACFLFAGGALGRIGAAFDGDEARAEQEEAPTLGAGVADASNPSSTVTRSNPSDYERIADTDRGVALHIDSRPEELSSGS
jgi:hypothetical protein